MKKLIILLLGSTLIAGLTSCKKTVFHNEKEFVIEYGSECGWCAGEEFVIINSSKIEYEKTIPCGENKGTETKTKEISQEEWDSIWSSFDYNLFKTLDYNECNVCVDGCDEIIRITRYDDIYEIRYTHGEEIDEIENLKQILAEILSSFNDHN